MMKRISMKYALLTFIFITFFRLFIYPNLKQKQKEIFIDEFVNRSSQDTIISPDGIQSQITLAVVLSLANDLSHIAEFHLLYESWRFIQNFSPLSDGVLIDLIVFCEQPSCSRLPSSCLPLSTQTHLDRTSKCFYEELKVEIVDEWRNYLYMTSIAFMLTEEYRRSIKFYQWILRVDQDALLSPALYFGLKQQHSIPLYKMQFGGIPHGIEFTDQRLKEIAHKLGYKHAGVHNLCSTWLVSPNDSIQLANLTTKIGKHFLLNEFGRHVQGLEDIPNEGEWPKWWFGVISLYAADIAINHFYFYQLTSQHGTEALDHAADSTSSIWSAWQIHCLHNPQPFSKFEHRDHLNAFLNKTSEEQTEMAKNIEQTQLILTKTIDEYHQFDQRKRQFTGTVTVRDYVTALAWQKAYSATGAISY